MRLYTVAHPLDKQQSQGRGSNRQNVVQEQISIRGGEHEALENPPCNMSKILTNSTHHAFVEFSTRRTPSCATTPHKFSVLLSFFAFVLHNGRVYC